MNNKIIKSFCYIFVFIFIAIIIFSVFNKKREGLDTSSSDKIINEITAMNPFGWYDSRYFDVTTQKWNSKVGNSSIQTKNLTKLTTPFPYVTGGTNATISNVPWPGENNDYTFIHLAKYNGPSRGRIWTGTTGNWLSGFWNNGVAFYHNGWYQNGINASNGGQDWLLSVDMKNFARINKGLWQANGPAYSPASIGVNSGAFGNEVSDFAIAEFIIFNRSLSQDEYTKIEDYFTKKYGLFGTPMDTSFTTIPSPPPPPTPIAPAASTVKNASTPAPAPTPVPAPAPQNQMKTDTTASSNKTDLKPAPIDKKPEVNFAELINLKQPNAVTEININLPARNTMPFADCESMLGCGTYLMPSFPPVPDYGAEPTPYFDPIKF